MLTRLRVKRFKCLNDVSIELGRSVVLIGPNNSGKTTALQAITLWAIGLREWRAKRKGKGSPKQRPGVTINRRDLISVPVPAANLLWHALHVRDSQSGPNEKRTKNVRIDVIVDGITNGMAWECGLEFDYANEESFVCRPVRRDGYQDVAVGHAEFTEIPEFIADTRIAFLPPMSGLSAEEFLKQPGEIGVLIGQGQTAQVLRNLCWQLRQLPNGKESWTELANHIRRLFGVSLQEPVYVAERSELIMHYRDHADNRLDISASGRGLQQTLLLLAYLYANPSSVLLLDEPDAHLEILRQRQTYQLLTEIAQEQDSQMIAASHSEVVLNEAAGRDVVIAFVGKPHRIDDRAQSQVAKALREIGFEHYYQAEQVGWVLYLEGSTDLAILQAFARVLAHEGAQKALEKPFVHYVGKEVRDASRHYFGLREAKSDLVGLAIFDRLERPLPLDLGLTVIAWERREIENYFVFPEVLIEYARGNSEQDLWESQKTPQRLELMESLIADLVPPVARRDRDHQWWRNTKITDEFLDPLFAEYFRQLKLPNLVRKSHYHQLADLCPRLLLPAEVGVTLDAIAKAAAAARPMVDAG